MQYKEYFVNKKCQQFLEVGNYDFEELSALKSQAAENVSIELDALKCLCFFPNIKHLRLLPGPIDQKDLVFLRNLHILSLTLDYYSEQIDEYTIDLSQFPELQYVFSRSQYNFCRANACESLNTLVVQEWMDKDLSCLKGGKIKAIDIFGGVLCSLEGAKELQDLHSLSLAYSPKLKDISAIDQSRTLESLSFEKCNNLEITTLTFLPALRYLSVKGRRTVKNLSFLQGFPVLEHIVLDIPIEDGDLTALHNFEHSVVLTDKKNFSCKNKDLPKKNKKFRSEFIPAWLEILPECNTGDKEDNA